MKISKVVSGTSGTGDASCLTDTLFRIDGNASNTESGILFIVILLYQMKSEQFRGRVATLSH